jgi:hypothetical protein
VLHRRVAAMMLAIQLYHHDRGVYPASLQELIPTYLSRELLDPRSADTKPLRYLLVGNGARPVICSVGSSTCSDAQILACVPKTPILPPRATLPAGNDIVLFEVTRWTLPSSTTREAGHNDVEKAQSPGNH